MDKKIIVARYNEDVYWAKHVNFADVIIYNKGEDDIPGAIRLPNVGRESGAYLRFIIDNYDDISPSTLYFFLQGNPFEHGVDLEKIEKAYTPCELGAIRWLESTSGVSNKYFPSGLPVKEFCEMIFVESPFESDTHSICGGALFCCYGLNIKKRCKQFYEFLNMYAESLNPLEGHIMERIWKYIMFTDVKDKITEYSKKRKVFARNASWNGIKID